MRGPMMAMGAVVAVAVLLLVGILLTVEFGLAGGEDYEAGAPMTFESATGDMTLSASLDPENPAVGQLAVLTGALTNASGDPVQNVQYEIAAFHLEDEKNMTKFDFLAPAGAFTWGFQFFDGAGHRLSVKAAPAGGTASFDPIRAESEVDVAGFDPPLSAKIKTVGYLLLVVLAGLVVGLLIRGGLSVRRAQLPKRAESEQAV